MKVLGHRGAVLDKGPFYQNSLAAFEEALLVSDGFESDACLTQDGEIFLIHEAKYVDPALGVQYCARDHLVHQSQSIMGGRRIDELSASEMASLRLHGDVPIPTLRQALELTGTFAGRQMDIELKSFGVVEPAIEVVHQTIKRGVLKPEGVFFSSFNHPALERVRAKAPDQKVCAIFLGDDQPSTALFPWRPESDGLYTALNDHELQNPLLKSIDPDFVMFPEEYLTAKTIDLVAGHYPKAQVMAWVFTERDNFNLADLFLRLGALHHTRKIAAILPDNPRQFTAAMPTFLRTA